MRSSQRPFRPEGRAKHGSHRPHLGDVQPEQEPHRFVLVVTRSFLGGFGRFSWYSTDGSFGRKRRPRTIRMDGMGIEESKLTGRYRSWNCPEYNLQRLVLLSAFQTIVVFDVLGLLLRNADTISVVPFLASVATNHEPGTIAATTNAVGLVVLFHYGCDFALSFRKIELLCDFFFLKMKEK